MTMNKLYIIGLLLMLVYWGTGCQDIPIGYLQTEDASYNPDTMVVKSVNLLDGTPPTIKEIENEVYYELVKVYPPEFLASIGVFPTITVEEGAGEDYQRVQWEMPWVSTPIEGVQGTAQIFVTIKSIREESGGSVAEALEQIKVYGDGTFEVPLKHTIPVGRYVISLNFRNEGYSKDVDDCFTIIVK